MTKNLYTFVGCAHAINHYIKASDANDLQDALAASSDLISVSEQILNTCPADASEEEVKAIFGAHVVTVLESIEIIRGTSIHAELDGTLIELLEYYYNAADSIMGGGGNGGSGGSLGPFADY